MAGAPPEVLCPSCEEAQVPSYESEWSRPDRKLLSAEAVGAALEADVLFVGRLAGGDVLLGETDAGESVVVVSFPRPDYSGGMDGDLEVYRLGPDSVGWRFVAISGQYFLACSSSECALYEAADPELGTVELLPGGTVPDGFIGTGLTLYEHQLCVLDASSTAWCFDRESWSEVELDASMDIDDSPFPPVDGPGTCIAPVGEEIALAKWQLGNGSYLQSAADTLIGVTADGAIVSGAWQRRPVCCCVRTSALGAPLDFELTTCGIAVNSRLLTSEALYGSLGCALD